MLSKRDKLVVRFAEQLGLLRTPESREAALAAKQGSPDKPFEKVLRDEGLITKAHYKALAQAFNEHVRKKKEASRRLREQGKGVPDLKLDTGGLHQKIPATKGGPRPPAGGIETEPTFVLRDEAAKPAPAPDLESEATFVLKDDAARPAPDLESEATFVMKEDRAAPDLESEPTFVMKDEEPAKKRRPEQRRPSSRRARATAPEPELPPDLESEPTFVMRDEGAKPAFPADPMSGSDDSLDIESEPTFVMRDESSPKRAPAPKPRSQRSDSDTDLLSMDVDLDSDFESESTLVIGADTKEIKDGRKKASEEFGLLDPTDFAKPIPAARGGRRPPPDELAGIEGESTLVLKDDEDSSDGLDLPPDVAGDDFESEPTLMLADEESATPLVMPDEAASADFESEPTFVLKDDGGKASGKGALDAIQDMSGELELVGMGGGSSRPESDLDLEIPDLGDPGGDFESEPTYVLDENKKAGAPKKPALTSGGLELGELSLASEGAAERQAPTKTATGSLRLTRDVFKRIAKKRESFEGYVIGDYQISGEISRGAMGVVLQATPTGMAKTMAQARGFAGDVALKVMLENNIDPKEAERFLEEMKVLTKLNHPNIVRIFDCGREGGLTYFSMELLQGEDVRDMVRSSGPPPFMLTMRIGFEIANALAYIHKMTVYHRDMKPTNIIFDKSQTPYRAVLIDFGLVTDKDAEGDKGLILGTPQYMPPEQASPRGGFGEVNATSDIYSLGATLYYMLTGRPPFMGRDPRKIIRRVVTEAVKDPCEINPEVPRKLGDIALKCLEKTQRDRYVAARLLAAELDNEIKASQRKLKAKSFLNRFWNPRG